jgi:hypothetical protein
MNKYYFIIPVVLLAGFVVVYRGAVHDMEVKETRMRDAVAATKAAEEKHRKEIEAKAQEDALKRQKENEAAEKAKLEKREKDYSDAMAKLKADTDAFNAEGDRFAKDGADLELKLSEARQLREKTNRDIFEISKQVELAKISRRKSEIEIQRMVEMVGNRATTLAAMPPPPPLAK